MLIARPNAARTAIAFVTGPSSLSIAGVNEPGVRSDGLNWLNVPPVRPMRNDGVDSRPSVCARRSLSCTCRSAAAPASGAFRPASCVSPLMNASVA